MFKKMRLFPVTLIALFVFACSAGLNLFNDKDEVSMGMQFDKEIRDNPKEYPIYNGNPAVKIYINSNVFQPILNSPEIKKADTYAYQIEIIDNDSILNAFAVPGGYVYIYTGILKYLDSEASLAGVLAHEIGHVERRHSTQRITNAYGLSILANLALGNNPSQIAEIVANMFTGLSLLANSRINEDESDEYSIKYLKSTKYYPGAVKFFFEKMRDDGKVASSSNGIQTFLSTHPDPIDRINSTNERLKAMGIEILSYSSTGSGMYKTEYQKNIKSKL
ncbi:MAG: M48 family metalloprotease [Melioribacteraceae bacterium]